MKASSARASAGFTLFEMIVVMVITSLMGAVLMQGFSLILAMRLSVTNTIENLQELILSQNVPIDPLRGILPDFKNGPNQFSGQARVMHGQTLRPLLSAAGAPTSFTMTLEYDIGGDTTVLVYAEPGRPKAELAQWRGNTITFKYRDLKGPWAQTWPQPESTSQTPWLIWIDTGPELALLIAAVSGTHGRVQRIQDSPFSNTAPPPLN